MRRLYWLIAAIVNRLCYPTQQISKKGPAAIRIEPDYNTACTPDGHSCPASLCFQKRQVVYMVGRLQELW